MLANGVLLLLMVIAWQQRTKLKRLRKSKMRAQRGLGKRRMRAERGPRTKKIRTETGLAKAALG
jgi:hypothetical protein